MKTAKSTMKRTRHVLPLPSGESLVFDWTPPGSTGRTAVFVHGLGSNRRGDKAEHFAERFADLGWGFLALDLRGHGESGGGMEQLTLSRCLEDLHAVLAWLPDPRSVGLMIGSSMGGAVTAWYQARHPAAGRCIALIAPAFRFPARFAELPAAEMAEWRRSGVRRFLSEWIDLKIGYSLVEDSTQYTFDELLRTYAAPTLILHGMQDVAVPWQDSVSFIERAACPNIHLLLIKEGDHRLTRQKAYLFDSMTDWLREHGIF